MVIGQLLRGGGASGAVCINTDVRLSPINESGVSRVKLASTLLQCLTHLLHLSGPVPSAPPRTTHFPLFIINIIYSGVVH